MAPEIDINSLSEPEKDMYDRWGKRKLDQGLVIAGPKIVSDTTAVMKMAIIDGEPITEYADNQFAPRVHKMYVSDKTALELREIGIPCGPTLREKS